LIDRLESALTMAKPEGEENLDNDDGGTFEYRVDVPASEQRLPSTTSTNEQQHQRHHGKTAPQHHELFLANGHHPHHRYLLQSDNTQHQELYLGNGHQHLNGVGLHQYPGPDPLQSANSQHQELYLGNGHQTTNSVGPHQYPGPDPLQSRNTQDHELYQGNGHQHLNDVGLHQYPGPDPLLFGNSQPQYLNGGPQYPSDRQENVVGSGGQQQYSTGTEDYPGTEQYPRSTGQSCIGNNGHPIRYPSAAGRQVPIPTPPEQPRDDNVDYNPEDEGGVRTATDNNDDRTRTAVAPGRQKSCDRRHHHHHHHHRHQCRHRHRDATPDVIVTSPPVVEPKPPRYEQFTHV